ncbi:MAG: single-stranded DNA-binding protein [Clostridiales bacterium]|nr:MAG: single-stranded DNA-binding protein [Clostridiales bacterium]
MNNVVLTGRLVRDPELRFISGSGMAVAQFTIAVDKNLSRDKKQQFEAQGKPTADFIRIVVWGKQAENCNSYLSKGRKVAINGSISTSSYVNKNGETVYTTDIIARNVEFLERMERRDSGVSQDSFGELDRDYDADFASIEDDPHSPF